MAAWLALFWSGPFVNDASWQIWMGRQLNVGASLYVDIFEINPPLWFWGGAAVAAAADAAGISGFDALKLAFGLAALVCVALVASLLPNVRERALTYGALFLVLALTSRSAFLQREQFTLIAALPYVVVTSRRAQGLPVRPPLALAAGLFAALGFALKHYFALVPLALALWLMWRRGRPLLPPELLAVAASAVAYGAAILLLTPEYLTTMLPLIRLAYAELEAPLFAQLVSPGVAACVAAIVGLTLARPFRSAVTLPALLAGCAFFLAYFLQSKAFFYHLIPALGMLAVAVAAEAAAALSERPVRWTALPAFAATLFLLVVTAFQTKPPTAEPQASRAVSGLPRGASVMVFTASGGSMWPLVEERGLVWPSRHMFFWMLRPIHASPRDPRMRALGHRVREQTADDLECTSPNLILLDTRPQHVPADWLVRFFQASPRLVAIMREYEPGPRTGPFLALWRREPAPRSCRPIAFAPVGRD